MLGALLTLPVASCTNPFDSPQPTVEASSSLGADEAETRAALGDLQIIEFPGPRGEIVHVEVPAGGVCDDAECAVVAALSFFAYQDDVTQGKLIAQWNALSGDDCYFCADTITVEEKAATFLVGMQWNGTHWTVETVAIT